MKSIDLQDGLNGDWLRILRLLRKAKSEEERKKIIEDAEKVELVEYSQEEINKILKKEKYNKEYVQRDSLRRALREEFKKGSKK